MHAVTLVVVVVVVVVVVGRLHGFVVQNVGRAQSVLTKISSFKY
jgi:hypothetical protein